ncbi:hypothetical protein ABKN59_006409 [Abortiporus biennis]
MRLSDQFCLLFVHGRILPTFQGVVFKTSREHMLKAPTYNISTKLHKWSNNPSHDSVLHLSAEFEDRNSRLQPAMLHSQ